MFKKSNYSVVQIITKMERGGAQLTTLILAEKIVNSILITGKKGLLLNEARKNLKNNLIISQHLIREINPYYDFKALIEIFQFLRKLKYKNLIVHTNSSKAGVLGRLASQILKIPCVHTIHGWSFNSHQNKIFYKLAVCIEKILSKYTEKIIVVTEMDIKKGLKNGIGNERKYSVVRAVTDMTPFKNGDGMKIRKELGISNYSKVVGTVAVFKPQKAPLDFIQAAKFISDKFKDVVFIMTGGGPLLGASIKKAKDLGIEDRIYFTGWRKDVHDIISSYDIFLLTSLWEGLPQVLLQAMAAGKAIVATAVDGSVEIIEDGVNGFLVAPNRPDIAADKVLELLEDNNKRRIVGNVNRKFVDRHFSVVKMKEDAEKIYREIYNKYYFLNN